MRKHSLGQDRWVYRGPMYLFGGCAGRRTTVQGAVIGVNDAGSKILFCHRKGCAESTQSWREVVLGLKSEA